MNAPCSFTESQHENTRCVRANMQSTSLGLIYTPRSSQDQSCWTRHKNVTWADINGLLGGAESGRRDANTWHDKTVQLSLTFTWCHGPYLQLWWHHRRSIKGGDILTFECTFKDLNKYNSFDMFSPMISYEMICYVQILPQYFRNLPLKKKSWYIPWEIPSCPHAHCRQHQAFWKRCEILYAALQQ